MNAKNDTEITNIKDSIANIISKIESVDNKQGDFNREIERRMIVLEVDKKNRDANITIVKRGYISGAIGLFFGLAQAFIIFWLITPADYQTDSSYEQNYSREELKDLIKESIGEVL